MPQPSDTAPILSLAIPCFNEEDVLDAFIERIRLVVNPLAIQYELVFVNDGSTDRTLDRLLAYQRDDTRILVIDLSRNFGKEAALTAAIEHSSGEAVIPIDADLQEPPELIPQMLDEWRKGFDVVTARRSSRKSDGALKRLSAQSFYRIFNWLSPTSIPYNTGDFRLLDRKVVDAFSRIGERNRFMKGIFAWLGFTQSEVSFERPERAAGESKFSPWKLWRFAIAGIFAFSAMPLRVWSYIGGLISGGAFIYASFLIIRTLILGIDVPGYASIMVVILFLGGIQLICLGVIGQYIGHIYEEVKQRPVYLTRSKYGFSNLEPNEPPR